jgi:hypothetical protein
MLPAQLLSVLHHPVCMPSPFPPFAKCAKDGAAKEWSCRERLGTTPLFQGERR